MKSHDFDDTKSAAAANDSRSIQTRRTRFAGRFYDQIEWEELIHNHEMYLMALLFAYWMSAFLIGCLSIFGHTNEGYYSKQVDKNGTVEHYGGIWQFCTDDRAGQ